MVTEKFKEIVKEIKKTGNGVEMTIRQFLWLFDESQKRTSGNVWRIREYLKKQKLITIPDFIEGVIDNPIFLKEIEKAKISKNSDSNENFDPISRVSNLEAANKIPVSIKKEDDINRAYHLMWKNDFSQLPVMNNDRDISGIINWKTIAKGLIKQKESKTVKDFMCNEYVIINHDTSIFEAIKLVVKKEVVFIKDNEGKIKGPITPSDLNEEFLEQIEPFILLEQIEYFIRLVLHNKITLNDLRNSIDVKDENRKIDSVSDMTFGEYIRVIEKPEHWEALKLSLDRAEFIKELQSIRSIRNSVMHFNLDKISKDNLKELRDMSIFLQDYLNN